MAEFSFKNASRVTKIKYQNYKLSDSKHNYLSHGVRLAARQVTAPHYRYKQVNFKSSNGSNNQNLIDEVNQKFIYARVVDIILDDTHPKFEELGGWSSIGTVFYLDIEVNNNDVRLSNIAKPLLPNLKNYPLVNEIVYLIKLIFH